MQPANKRTEKSLKLNATLAHAMRQRYAEGAGIWALAEEFGVSDSTVHNVVNYETWVKAGPPKAEVFERRRRKLQEVGEK